MQSSEGNKNVQGGEVNQNDFQQAMDTKIDHLKTKMDKMMQGVQSKINERFEVQKQEQTQVNA